MAKLEQKVNDIRELLTLVSETMVENDGKLDTLDNHVNTTGTTVVETHKTATEVKDIVVGQAEAIMDVKANQETVAETTNKLIDIILESKEVFSKNNTSLADILESIKDNETLSKDQHSMVVKLINTVEDHQKQTSNKLHDDLNKIDQTIAELNISENLNMFIEEINKTTDVLHKINATEQQGLAAQNKRLDDFEVLMNENMNKLDVLIEKANDLGSDFQTSIARISNIALKVDTILESTPELDVIDLTSSKTPLNSEVEQKENEVN